jgi:hypothetical protein
MPGCVLVGGGQVKLDTRMLDKVQYACYMLVPGCMTCSGAREVLISVSIMLESAERWCFADSRCSLSPPFTVPVN